MGASQDLFLDSSIRLRNHDYSAAQLYFVTVCTHQRRCLFGDVVDGGMQLNTAGATVLAAWRDIGAHHRGVSVDAVVVMPNHVHGIVLSRRTMAGDAAANQCGVEAGETGRTVTVGEIVRAFRARCQLALGISSGFSHQLWQDSFHTSIIRDQRAYDDTVRYIENDPQRWQHDIYFENPRGAICRALFRRVQANPPARIAV